MATAAPFTQRMPPLLRHLAPGYSSLLKKHANETQANPLSYRALVTLKTPYLERDRVQHKLAPGMQVTAKINLGSRTVLEYLLSPVQKTVHEAGWER